MQVYISNKRKNKIAILGVAMIKTVQCWPVGQPSDWELTLKNYQYSSFEIYFRICRMRFKCTYVKLLVLMLTV